MKAMSTALAFVLSIGFSGTAIASPDSFNDKGISVVAPVDRAKLLPVRYNTSIYNATFKPRRVTRTQSGYNDRNGEITKNPVYKMEVSYSLFECGIVTAPGYNDRNLARKAC